MTSKAECNKHSFCAWTTHINGHVGQVGCIVNIYEDQDHISSSFVNLEAGVGVDEEHFGQDEEDIGGLFDDDGGGYWRTYKDEDGDKDGDIDTSSDSELDLEDEPNANVSDKKRSYLRTN